MLIRALLLGLAVLLVNGPAHAVVIFSASGAGSSDILGTVDSFRADLGALNPNVVGSFGSGRREINWDGVPDAFAAPNNLPSTFFNVTSPRGVLLGTPGAGFQVSANSGGVTPVEFGNINASYPSLFVTFSPQRLFTALGSTVTDVQFFVPGTSSNALVRGFGAVFTDVDLANTTSMEFFNADNVSLGTFFVPAFSGNERLSFLGVDFGPSVVSRVRITSGNEVLGASNNEDATHDLVVMDDFIFAEPAAVPEPGSALLLVVGLLILVPILRPRDRLRWL